jgi:hypothetical protein
VQNLSNSLVVRNPDHFFNNKYRHQFPEGQYYRDPGLKTGKSFPLWTIQWYPASKHTVGEFAGFGWSVSGCPGGGREFGNATDWKIAQPGQH